MPSPPMGRRPPCGVPTICSGGVASEDVRLGSTLPEPSAPPVSWSVRSRWIGLAYLSTGVFDSTVSPTRRLSVPPVRSTAC